MMIALIAAVCVAVALHFPGLWAVPETRAVHPSPDPLSLVFDQGILQHGTPAALRRFGLLPGTHVIGDLRPALSPQFPGFPDDETLDGSGELLLQADGAEDHARLSIAWKDGLCWIDVTDAGAMQAGDPAHETQSRWTELVSQSSPHPVWITDHTGSCVWSNSAYDALISGGGAGLFDTLDHTQSRQRIEVEAAPNRTDWYEVTIRNQDAHMVCEAVRITDLVQAELAQRGFVQTLAKSFAHLPIALAIFDAERRLTIFNPALVDLTGLSPADLAAKPTIHSFFDQLRENRLMPEPKDYANWRDKISNLIAAAADGHYLETWALEDGRTYSVQGRPHPDGATAFLIEDISAEIALSRTFRSEVAQYEALLDQMSDALVVFSATGVLTLCNAAYRDLWGQNPEATFADLTIHDAVRHWSRGLSGDAGWDRLTRFVTTLGPRKPTRLSLPFGPGKVLRCELTPIAAAATLIAFRVSARREARRVASTELT